MSQTVTRAIETLHLITEKPRTLGQVAKHLGVHRSTALRLLQTLEKAGFSRRLADGKHVVGFAIIPLAQAAMDRIDVRVLAHAHLEGLAHRIGHTVHLAQLIGDDIIYVDKVDGSGSVAMGSRIGLPAEGHTAGVAKVILAHMSGAQRERALARLDYRQYTSTTIATPTALHRELSLTRSRGWAEDDGEKEDYINCVAVPVFDASGTVTLGLSVTALRVVAPLGTLRDTLPLIRSVAHTISKELGWKGDEHGRR